jgi:hypothetical protein
MSNTYLIEIRIARLSYPDEIPPANAKGARYRIAIIVLRRTFADQRARLAAA